MKSKSIRGNRLSVDGSDTNWVFEIAKLTVPTVFPAGIIAIFLNFSSKASDTRISDAAKASETRFADLLASYRDARVSDTKLFDEKLNKMSDAIKASSDLLDIKINKVSEDINKVSEDIGRLEKIVERKWIKE